MANTSIKPVIRKCASKVYCYEHGYPSTMLSSTIRKLSVLLLAALLHNVSAGKPQGKGKLGEGPHENVDTQFVCDDIYGKGETESLNARQVPGPLPQVLFDCQAVSLPRTFGVTQALARKNSRRIGMICPTNMYIYLVQRGSILNPGQLLTAAICVVEEDLHRLNNGLSIKAGSKNCKNVRAPDYGRPELDMDGMEDEGTSYSSGRGYRHGDDAGSWGHKLQEVASLSLTELSGPVVAQALNTDHLTVKDLKPGHIYRACAQAMLGEGNVFVSLNFVSA